MFTQNTDLECIQNLYELISKIESGNIQFKWNSLFKTYYKKYTRGRSSLSQYARGSVSKNRDNSVIDFIKTYCSLRIFYCCPNIQGASMVPTIVFRYQYIRYEYKNEYIIYITLRDRTQTVVSLSVCPSYIGMLPVFP